MPTGARQTFDILVYLHMTIPCPDQVFLPLPDSSFTGAFREVNVQTLLMTIPNIVRAEIAWSQIISFKVISNPKRETGEEKVLGSGDDSLSDNALLAEHLRNSKPWRAFADWDRNLKKHRNACGQL